MLRDRVFVALTVCLVAALIVVLAIGCSSSTVRYGPKHCTTPCETRTTATIAARGSRT